MVTGIRRCGKSYLELSFLRSTGNKSDGRKDSAPFADDEAEPVVISGLQFVMKADGVREPGESRKRLVFWLALE